MSLEQALAENTAALRDLLAAITAGKLPAATPEVAATPAGKPKAEKEAEPKPTPAPQPETPAATPPTAEAAPAAAPEKKPGHSAEAPKVEYLVLQKAVFALAGKSREAAAAVAASFGVKTFKDLDPAKWAEALAAVQKKTAELESA